MIWHNIKLNPNDLPIEGCETIIAVKNSLGNICYLCDSYSFVNKHWFIDTGKNEIEILAWSYIDEFKE